MPFYATFSHWTDDDDPCQLVRRFSPHGATQLTVVPPCGVLYRVAAMGSIEYQYCEPSTIATLNAHLTDGASQK